MFVSSEETCFCSESYDSDETQKTEEPDEKPTHPVMEKKITLDVSELTEEAGLPGQPIPGIGVFVNKSDLLALLHRKAGLQVMSDHHSEWFNCHPVKDCSIRDLLDTCLSGDYRSESNWRFEDGTVFIRIRDARKLDATEVPNRLLRRWKAAVKRKGYLGLDELAEIAQLNEDQTVALGHYAWFLGLGYSEHLTSKPLRFYGRLSTTQRRQLFSEGLAVAGLTQDQYESLLEILEDEPVAQKTLEEIHSDWVVVGVYKDGIRTDKPGMSARLQTVPGLAVIRMVRDEDYDWPFLDPRTIMLHAEDTGDQSGSDDSKKRIHEIIRQHRILVCNASYQIILEFPDGHQQDFYISFPTNKVAEPEKVKAAE